MAQNAEHNPPSPPPVGCFACDPEHPGGLRLVFEIDVESRTARAQTVLAESFAGADGIAHGGIVATVLDEAMVYASRSVMPLAATASLNIRYRRPTPVGVPLTITAEVVWARGRAVGCRARVTSGGEVCAEAEGTLLPIHK